MNLVLLDAFHAGEAWTKERRPQAEAMLDGRLKSLSAWLGEQATIWRTASPPAT